jgi:hypothetical protein
LRTRVLINALWYQTLLAVAALALTTQAAAHKLVRAGSGRDVVRKAFVLSPTIDWNRLSGKDGKYQEIWSLDGDQLNKVTFFGGVPTGEPLFREANKKEQPLPKVSANMLITDIPALLENSYRAEGRTNQMSIGKQEPAMLDGRAGIRFEYTYVFQEDDVSRKGEALGSKLDFVRF